MNALPQLESDYQKAKEKGARPELLKKLEDQMRRFSVENASGNGRIAGTDDDPFECLFQKAMQDLNQRDTNGSSKHIRNHHPDLYRQIDEAERRIDEVWKAGLVGKPTIEEFREVVKHWYLLYLQGIEIYRKEHRKSDIGVV